MVLSAETVGVEAWSVSVGRVGVAAWFASAERVDVAALSASAEMASVAVLGRVVVVASAHALVWAEAAVWALAWVLAQVLVVVLVLSLPAVSLEAGVCLPHSQPGAQFLAEWGPLLDAGEVYRLAVDEADPYWDAALPLVWRRGLALPHP